MPEKRTSDDPAIDVSRTSDDPYAGTQAVDQRAMVLYSTFRPDDPLRAQLDRIEAKLDQLLASTGTVRFLKFYDWDTGSIERIREGSHE